MRTAATGLPQQFDIKPLSKAIDITARVADGEPDVVLLDGNVGVPGRSCIRFADKLYDEMLREMVNLEKIQE